MHAGPELKASVNKLTLIYPSRGESKKIIKLINHSRYISAKFIFDIDKKQCPFKLDITSGCVRPKSDFRITISFKPVEERIYYFSLPCLVLHQDPIIIELYGYYRLKLNTNDHKMIDIYDGTNQANGLTNFEKYFNNSRVKRRDKVPYLSLSHNNIVFEKKNHANPYQYTSITNHSSEDYLLEWEKDIEGIFHAHPRNQRINKGNTGQFQIHFQPIEQDKFYIREITVYATTYSSSASSREELTPTVVSIRLMGYWRLNNTKCIDENIKRKRGIKERNNENTLITLPPAIPGTCSYCTFILHNNNNNYNENNNADDSLAFQFFPENECLTKFNIKSMFGIINKNNKKYQIIAVEMLPHTRVNYLYSERWTVKFYGISMDRTMSIKFQGLNEYPKIQIGCDNEIKFDSVHLDCEQEQFVPVKNLSHYHIRYEFTDLPEFIKLNELIDEIYERDEHYLKCIFCPSEVGEYDANILCSIIPLDKNTSLEEPIKMKVHVCGVCKYGSLKADPDELDLGEIPCKESKTSSFVLSNTSDVTIPFKLSYQCLYVSNPFKVSKIRFQPRSRVLLAGESQEITIHVKPLIADYFKVFIKYSINKSSTIKTICSLTYSGILSSPKIIDLEYYQTGSLFGKYFLWKMLKINLLNKIIRDLNVNEEKNLNLYLPNIVWNFPAIIKLLIKNVSTIPTLWSIKRIPCKKNQQMKSCDIDPMTGILNDENVVVTIELRQPFDCLDSKWVINLDNNRHITLNISHKSQFLYSHCIFDDVYLGDLNPLYQVAWIYNSSENNLNYSLDIDVFGSINNFNRSNALTCANPTMLIKPRMLEPILLKFHPRRLGNFKISVPFTIGNDKNELNIAGNATLIKMMKKIPKEFPELQNCFDRNTVIKVKLSSEIIILSSILINDSLERSVKLHNSSDDIFEYDWIGYEVPDVISCRVEPENGLIYPKEMRTARLIIKTGTIPCRIDINIACKLINISEKREYDELLREYENTSAEAKKQLVITEKRVFHPPKSEKTFLEPTPPNHRIVTLCCAIYNQLDLDENEQNIFQLDEEIMKEKERKFNEYWNEQEKISKQILYSRQAISEIMQTILDDVFKNIMQIKRERMEI